MNTAKRILTFIFCLVFCLGFCPTVFAADNAAISLSNVSAMPEETVTIDVEIKNNPGIMGMAFSIAYDNDAFEYVKYENGWLSGMTVKDHPDKGHVIFVYVATKDKTDNGKMLSVDFKIKQKATPGHHTITLANNNFEKHGTKLHNSFSNSKQEFIVPNIKSGSIKVGETCINAGHKYGEWNITKEATCTETGLKNHTCVRDESICIEEGRYEEVEIPITHDFEKEWTVDEVATPEKDGVMTRHCTKCDAVTDRVVFTYEEVGGEPPTPSDPSTSSGNSTDNPTSSTPSAPIINNTLGTKNPITSIEHVKDFQTNVKPNLKEDLYVSEPEDTSSADDTLTATTDETDGVELKAEGEKPFLSTPLGIITMVLCGILSLGVIGLGIFLIIRARKLQ
ncbi:MAG: cohesin domain-containing protein [Clostridia bacterium]|nr:cohesin domain-containing protein [Clostridia bacterium]